MEQSKSPNKAIIGIIVVVLLVAAATAVVVLSSKSATNDEASTATASVSPSPSTSTEASTSTAVTSSFKDGTYTATGSYQTPGGRESIGVSVTLSSGTITDATVTQNASAGEAAEYQSAFVSGFKSLVVGKKIDEVSLTRVAGSSLTPNGFNSAITDIESQAKA